MRCLRAQLTSCQAHDPIKCVLIEFGTQIHECLLFWLCSIFYIVYLCVVVLAEDKAAFQLKVNNILKGLKESSQQDDKVITREIEKGLRN